VKATKILIITWLFLAFSLGAVKFKDGYNRKDFLKIETARTTLEILLSKEDHQKLVALQIDNLQENYIKSLFDASAESIDDNYIKFHVGSKYARNLNCFDEDSLYTKYFMKAYYVIKLKDTHEIIGTLEIYNDAEFGLFITNTEAHKGYGVEVINAAMAVLIQKTTAPKVIWDCNRDNPGSVGVAQKCGFEHIKDWEVYEGRIASRFEKKLI
jgi:hypothetical protein